MSYRKYTQCYNHVPPDRPFNENNMISFILIISLPLVLPAIASFVAGFHVAGGLLLGMAYGIVLIAVANQVLYHRLACLTGRQCAIGKIYTPREYNEVGEFDNDEFFDVWLMPHPMPPKRKKYIAPGEDAYKDLSEGEREKYTTDVYNDKFQGEELLKKSIADLPFKADLQSPVGTEPAALHCEAEGDFWVRMRSWAPAAALLMAGTATAAANVGEFLGPLICAALGLVGLAPLCLFISRLVVLASVGGAAYGLHMALSYLAFNADPGDVEDANVGDEPLGALSYGDKVVVYGEHIYDGFHEGWHEFHPLMAVMKLRPDDPDNYIEQGGPVPAGASGLTDNDMEEGLNSPAFRARAVSIKDSWCGELKLAFDDEVIAAREDPLHRWTIHPLVDGCEPGSPPSDLI